MNSHLQGNQPNDTVAALRVERAPVLVSLHPDGYVEVHADRHVDVHIAIVPAMRTKAGEILAEEYVELNLPPRYRRLFAPGMVRAAKMNRVVTPHDIADVIDDLAVVRTINSLAVCQREEARSWTL